jgi:hypothetical protein
MSIVDALFTLFCIVPLAFAVTLSAFGIAYPVVSDAVRAFLSTFSGSPATDIDSARIAEGGAK